MNKKRKKGGIVFQFLSFFKLELLFIYLFIFLTWISVGALAVHDSELYATPTESSSLYFIAVLFSALFLVSDLLIKYAPENVFWFNFAL